MSEISFETEPSRYRHLRLEAEADRARLVLKVDENGGLRSDYPLKLNSYDLGVDIEMADAVIAFASSILASRWDRLHQRAGRVFCAGANIFMLASTDHGFKVNFCKFTNETRLAWRR